MSKKKIITIGREKGSGGHYVGQILAERLGIPCYDSEILAETARQSGLAENFIENHEEQAPSRLIYSLALGTTAFPQYQSVLYQIHTAQHNAIRELAEKGPCVFVGRCADYVLKDRDDVLNCFIMAPVQQRIKRVCERENVSEDEAQRIIRRVDKARTAYSAHYTDEVWGRASRYHLALDTSIVTIPGAAEIIIEVLNRTGDDEKEDSIG